MPATNELLQEGRYRVSQPISQDGTVFEAYDTVRNTTVLVREFPVRLNKVTTVSQQESIKLAFATQAKALSEIEHESLLHVEDYFSEIDRQFLVMESVEGEALDDLLNRSKRPFPVTEVLRWADQLLDALDYLHSRRPSVIHRNVRPQNLRLHPSGKLKLLGVGLDSGADAETTESEDLRYSPMEQIWPGLDAASQKVITNSYDDRSERILKEPLDARSDIYSLGATLYFLVSGREPVDPLERSIDILEGKLDPLREPTKVDSRIPAEISDVLMKALEIKRENRYDSAVIMRQVLKTAIGRVEEREAEDAREQAEAAEFIRLASQPKPAPNVDLEAREAERLHQEELARQQEREAEAMRVADEQRARAEREEVERAEAARLEAERAEAERVAAAERAEAQRLEAERLAAERAEAERLAAEQAEATRLAREEQEAERAEAERVELERLAQEVEEQAAAVDEDGEVADDDLLEIPVSAEVMAYRDNSNEVDENELAAVLEELEKAEQEAGQTEDHKLVAEAPVEAIEEDVEVAEVQEIEVEAKPAKVVEAVATEYEMDSDLFAEPEKSGFSLPIPAIAGAIGLVVVIAVAAWIMMSGSSQPTPQPQPVQVEVVPPVQSEPTTPTADVVVSTDSQTPDANTAAAAVPADQQNAAPKAAPTAKPKKDKEAEKKKAVTVDDLINDN